MIDVAFGAASLVVLAATWLARCVTCQKLGLMLFWSWAVSNMFVFVLGWQLSPRAFAVCDLFWALYTCSLARAKEDRWASVLVFLIFLIMGALHLTAFAVGVQGTRRYFEFLNVLYALQLLVVGGCAGARIRLARVVPGDGGFRGHDPASVRAVRGPKER